MKHIDKKYCFKKKSKYYAKTISTIMSELYQKVAVHITSVSPLKR